MSELATALYDEEVLHGDEVPDAALELAGGKLGEGPAAAQPARYTPLVHTTALASVVVATTNSVALSGRARR